jgi:hypothetical protein
MLVKYAFLKVGIATSDMARYVFFNNVQIQMSKHVFSFQDLENGILRKNRKAVAALTPQFANKMDERIALVLPKIDCRIHFALNCGALSCPSLNHFTVEAIEEELRIVAQAFCEDDSQVRIGSDYLHLSKIFSWYQIDFGNSPFEMAKTILTFLRGKKHQQLKYMLLEKGSAVKIKYNHYDWSSNASDFKPFSGGNVRANLNRLLQMK